MDKYMLLFYFHVHVNVACHVHAACPYSCCLSMSMLLVHVHVECPRLCCMFTFMLYIHGYATYSRPCCTAKKPRQPPPSLPQLDSLGLIAAVMLMVIHLQSPHPLFMEWRNLIFYEDFSFGQFFLPRPCFISLRYF